MAEPTTDRKPTSYIGSLDDPAPAPNDPGRAHAKGYVAETSPGKPAPEKGPVPLATDNEVRGEVHKPDQSHAVQSTEPGEYSPNNRVMGSDR